MARLRCRPGDRLPGIPSHSFKGGVSYELTDIWDVSLQTILVSGQVFRGDEGNDLAELDGYGLLNFRSVYHITDMFDLFVRIVNILDVDYSTFGVLAEVEIEIEESPHADDPRFISPGAPRSAFADFHVRF